MSARPSADLARAVSLSSQSRRSSLGQQNEPLPRHSSSGCCPNPDVFSDDYSLDRIDSEASQSYRNPSVSSVGTSTTLYSNRLTHESAVRTSPRDSIENPFGDAARVSFDETSRDTLNDTPHRSSLPQKGGNRDSLTSSVNTAPSIAQRSQSSSSRFSIPPRALSPYRGATGPSHPYAMYPQVGVGRSPSVTTTSSVRPPDRPLGDSTTPQHPYAMYPQNVVVEEGMDGPVIPVGFPGHNQPYRRPPGRADDDIADIVGPDGHTEQLPPYSRYPDGVVPAVEPVPEPHNNNPDTTTDEDHLYNFDGPPASGTSSRTLVSERSPARNSQPPTASAAAAGQTVLNEKAEGRGPRRVCCGLPIWTFVLIAVVMVICAVIGGVIGGLLGAKRATDEGNKNHTTQTIVTVTTTPGFDATPLATQPTNVPPLPTGQFIIPPSLQNSSKLCLVNQASLVTWSCLQESLLIDVEGSGTQNTVTFQNQSVPGFFKYGAQMPYFHSDTKKLNMVLDKNDYGFGPALSFYDVMDKLVILPEDKLSADAVSKQIVSSSDILQHTSQSNQVAQVGDQPWFCWWNSTIMEFFLYVNQTTTESFESDSSSMSGKDGDSSTDSVAHYPRRIKIEEKRNLPGAKEPYCQQMRVMDGGYIVALSNTISISEVEPSSATTVIGGSGSQGGQTYRPLYGSSCYCAFLT
ncbi:hypothetical protein MPDQ_006361 [Monascus purpureus]|uniref:DUF7820 domain-containing protein n=1 Tax=Monascus purpureus TaxID=5098 RepID=A0A507QY61_MONPU|nr:hypothetical protein MPDQ_006361 [Monascus purpureus]BDD56896.1 hypothetical protein MAP00_002311 [Monascus purpureus]